MSHKASERGPVVVRFNSKLEGLQRALASTDLQAVSVIVAASLLLHIVYLVWSVPLNSPTGGHLDVWGDGVHFWLLSYLTATHGFVYQDLKPIGLQIVWLPLHPMITATVMRLTGNYSLDVIHSLNVFYGVLVSVVAYYLCKRLYSESMLWAFAAGLGLAFNAWWIAFSSDGIVEPLLTLSVLCTIYFWVKGDMMKASVCVLIAGFVKYEAWFITGAFFLISIYLKRFTAKTFFAYLLAFVTPIAIWSWWSWFLAGNPLAWYYQQVSALAWDASFLGKPTSLLAWALYPRLVLVMTAGLFLFGAIVALKRGGLARWLCLVALAYLAFRAWGSASGWTVPNERYVALLIPFAYILSAPILPKSLSKPRARTIYCIALLLLLLIPFVYQISVFPRMSYVNDPQVRAGLWLQRNYISGLIVCDLPIVIGYAFPNPKPNEFLSTAVPYDAYISHAASLRWLYEYFRSRGIVYFVWNYVSYSASWQFDTATGSFLNLGSGKDTYFFKLVYADTGWEHQYGVPNLYVYQIDYNNDWLQPGILPN